MRGLVLTIVIALLVGISGARSGHSRLERAGERSTIQVGIDVAVRIADRRDAGPSQSSELRLPIVVVSIAPALPDPPRVVIAQPSVRSRAMAARLAVTAWSRGPPSV